MEVALYLILLTSFTSTILNNALRYFPAIKFDGDACLSEETVKATANPIVRSILKNDDGPWRLVVSLNMSDSQQNCPSNWSLLNSPRSCTHGYIPSIQFLQ